MCWPKVLILYPREVFSVTIISGLSHMTRLAASSHDMPEATPVTSSTGMPAGCAVGALAGHFTLPRISFATCSALAAPEGAAGDECAVRAVALFALFDPQAAIESAAHVHVTHSKRLIASVRRREIKSPFSFPQIG